MKLWRGMARQRYSTPIRQPVHQRGLHRQADRGGRGDFDGRARAFSRQYFHRAPVPTAARPAPALANGWPFTTTSARTRRWTIKCRWPCGAPAWTRSKRRQESKRQKELWICRFAWTTQTRCPHTHSSRRNSSRRQPDFEGQEQERLHLKPSEPWSRGLGPPHHCQAPQREAA